MSSVMPYSSNEHKLQALAIMQKLTVLTRDDEYTLNQVNGQRIFRKRVWSGPEPSRNCEIFIGRIPHDCFEDTLVPLFQKAGELFEFRMMINFSGNNRGYAFAMYTSEAGAANAIRVFDNFLIRPSWHLGVCQSVNNCRLYIARLPRTLSTPMIVSIVYALTEEVHEVRVRRSLVSCSAIVEYKSHRGAAMARKALVAAASASWGPGARPAVDWSTQLTPQLMRQYKEVGRVVDGMVVTRRLEEEGAAGGGRDVRGASQSLERAMFQERRLRAIQEAQCAATRQYQHQHQLQLYQSNDPAHDHGTYLYNYGLPMDFSSSLIQLELEGYSPPNPSAPPADFNPWTTRDPFGRFMEPPNKQ